MRRGLLFLLALVFSVATISNVEAGFIKSYDFNGNLSDTLGNGVDLISGGGTINGGRYHFDANQGLTLNSAVTDTTSYAIEFRLRINDNVAGWNKFVDFKDLTADSGLYILDGEVQFFPFAAGGGSLTTGVDYTIGLERTASGLVSVFLDNSFIFSFNDTTSLAVPTSNILHFFMDDIAVTGEAFAGSVDFIRIHDDSSTFGSSPSAVPEPFSAAIWGAGLVAGVIARRRSRSKK